MDKLKMHSKDKTQENFEILQRLFPNAVTETITGYDEDGKAIVERAIDKDVLQQEINATVVDGKDERYQFTWPDKKRAVISANAPINKTLRPCREESVNFDTTENLYIEGDNLEVLKLLQETYLGKIKMIYIDPPYNTGHDFVYNDKFSVSPEEWDEMSGELDEYGNRLTQNTESNGRFHTDWLNMIYPRLKIARDLLTDDGVIFISIDDNEVGNIRKICDEIFGEINLLSQIIVQHNKRGQTYKQISRTHEYILIYTKFPSTEINELSKDENDSDLNLTDSIGNYSIRELRNRNPKFGRHNRPNLFYPIYVNPDLIDKDGFSPISLKKDSMHYCEVLPLNSLNQESCWRWSTKLLSENIIQDTQCSNVVARRKGDGNYNIYEKYRKTTYKPKSIWDEVGVITEKGTVELGELGLSSYFDFPKPIELIKKCSVLGLDKDSIVLDFFSGSATTAHAVMQLNAEDNSNRKFIMVQLPEKTDEKSEAYKAGYKNICEIGKERIRRAGAKIKSETGADIDYGFRVLKLDSSNMKDVYYNPADFSKNLLDTTIDNIKEDRTPEDLLFQVMLDLGVLLSSKIEETEIAGKKVFNVADGFLIACFDNDVNEEVITAVAKQQPIYFVMRDSSLSTDTTATNFDQIFETYSPDTVRKVI